MTTLTAYTGPTPETGYVGYLNVSRKDDEVTVTVRPESDDGSGTSTVTIPVDAAKKSFAEALVGLEGVPLTDAQIKHMVNRFLAWKLPEHFHPDAGISFTPIYPYPKDGPPHEWPIGTNLLDYTQAEAMIRHMIAGV